MRTGFAKAKFEGPSAIPRPGAPLNTLGRRRMQLQPLPKTARQIALAVSQIERPLRGWRSKKKVLVGRPPSKNCGHGETGRRAGFRFPYITICRFKSCCPHTCGALCEASASSPACVPRRHPRGARIATNAPQFSRPRGMCVSGSQRSPHHFGSARRRACWSKPRQTRLGSSVG